MERVSAFFYGDANSTNLWAAWCLEYNLDAKAETIENSWELLCTSCDEYLEWCLQCGMVETSVQADPIMFTLFHRCQKELYKTRTLGFNIQLDGYVLCDPRSPELIAFQHEKWNH